MERVDGAEMFEFIATTKRFEVPIARAYFKTLLNTLEYIHKTGITHRDIKPENIMIDSKCQLKIIDFGLSTYLRRGELKSSSGTLGYVPPEWYKKKYQGDEVDIFSSGVILFLLVVGHPPFHETVNDPYYKQFCNNKNRFWEIHSKKLPPELFTAEFKDLINRMFNPVPA